jgi:hypothetical protein
MGTANHTQATADRRALLRALHEEGYAVGRTVIYEICANAGASGRKCACR